jgi:hypothetical protein
MSFLGTKVDQNLGKFRSQEKALVNFLTTALRFLVDMAVIVSLGIA